MAVITLAALHRLLFKHHNSPHLPTNVKLGLGPIQNCQRKRSYAGRGLMWWSFGWCGAWCVCKGKWRADEDGELSVGSSRVFYGNGCTTWRSSLRCIWSTVGGFGEGGCPNALLQDSLLSLWKNAGVALWKIQPPGQRGDGETWVVE